MQSLFFSLKCSLSSQLMCIFVTDKKVAQKKDRTHAVYLPIPKSEKKSFNETCTGSFHPRRENFMHFSSQRGYLVMVCRRKHQRYYWLTHTLLGRSIRVHFMTRSQNTVCHWEHSNTLSETVTHQIVHLQQLVPLPSFLLPHLLLTSHLCLVLYRRI